MLTWFTLSLSACVFFLFLLLRALEKSHRYEYYSSFGKGEDMQGDSRSNDFLKSFYSYLDHTIQIPGVRHGNKSTIETLINEEALLIGFW